MVEIGLVGCITDWWFGCMTDWTIVVAAVAADWFVGNWNCTIDILPAVDADKAEVVATILLSPPMPVDEADTIRQ